ncbi:MAG: LD-carboxypeptidase [Chitinophagaceae bacterium]|nr:LD-carboxypeptidase [Chitinophagaceae bacterium]
MDRKKFLTGSAALLSFPLSSFSASHEPEEDLPPVIPHYLRKGDLIGITAPAGFMMEEEMRPAIQQIESWGYRTRLGSTIGKKDFTFAGTDKERADDFQQMLDDPEVKAILCARGGYGAVRIIDQLKWDTFKKHPKWIIGFSDVTVFHSHINRNLGFATIHSKMTNSFPEDWSKAEPIQIDTILSIQKALGGEQMEYNAGPNMANRLGKAEGVLVGGNLKTIESLAGSRSDLRTTGKILFVEDTGEYLYSIDRMFWNLKRSNKLSGLKGLIIGGFKIKKDEGGDEFGKTLEEIVMEKVKEYAYPVCFDFPVGHQKNNFALKCGVVHELVVGEEGCRLKEVSGRK